MARMLGPRRACVARELTKLHEETVRGTLPELAERFAEGARGEVTIVVAGAAGERAPASPDELEALDAEIRRRIGAGASSREIAAQLARPGLSRREIYARAVALREAATRAGRSPR
jgi:16S rRNA (cytidine1402-2'-O)-methyltransferase